MTRQVGPEPERSVNPAMVTDLYELTMAAAYQEAGINHRATFELYVRRLPEQRRFLVAAGLDDALTGLEDFRFSPADVAYLADEGTLPKSFLAELADLRFTGDVWAVPEGEVVFADEPLVRVSAPLIEAQLVETFLLNQIASHTMLASKAARVAIACGDRDFVDFSARRDHGVSAAMAAARSAWIAGAVGTSLVAAGRRWAIPVSGTMAHSFVMSFPSETAAFRAYARSFPHGVILLIDTYDTLAGARNGIKVAQELAGEGISVRGVRLDSGDLLALSFGVRELLDQAGMEATKIFASGDLDEHRIAALVAAGAPVDAFGVGTQLGTSADAASLGAVYKLVEDARGPHMKLATGKVTLPGAKQVWRLDGSDVLSLAAEEIPGGRPLLQQVMEGGRRLPGDASSLESARERCRDALAALPPDVLDLQASAEPVWPLRISDGLQRLKQDVQARLAASDRSSGRAGRDATKGPAGVGG